MEWTFFSLSEERTKQLAAKLAVYLQPGDVITLSGNLGAGKTTFTKGLAAGLEIKRSVTSPTFTIIKEYQGRLPLYHIDAYRLEDSDEDIGFGEYLDGEGVTVIEWAVFIEDFLPDELLAISITYETEDTRQITFRATGSRYESILNALDIPEENQE